MANTKSIRVDESLIEAFRVIGKSFAEDIKKRYNLNELFVSDILASKLIAGSITGKKNFKFKVRKTGLMTGILEID